MRVFIPTTTGWRVTFFSFYPIYLSASLPAALHAVHRAQRYVIVNPEPAALHIAAASSAGQPPIANSSGNGAGGSFKLAGGGLTLAGDAQTAYRS